MTQHIEYVISVIVVSRMNFLSDENLKDEGYHSILLMHDQSRAMVDFSGFVKSKTCKSLPLITKPGKPDFFFVCGRYLSAGPMPKRRRIFCRDTRSRPEILAASEMLPLVPSSRRST